MSRECKVLIVDDSDEDVLLLKRGLSRFPHMKVVWRAKDGAEAIGYLGGSGDYSDREKHPWPDLVLLDLKMPNVDGFEVLEWARGKRPRPLIGVLTSSNNPADLRRAQELGADMLEMKEFGDGVIDRYLHFLDNLAVQRRML